MVNIPPSALEAANGEAVAVAGQMTLIPIPSSIRTGCFDNFKVSIICTAFVSTGYLVNSIWNSL